MVIALGGFSDDTAAARAVDLAGTDSAPSAWGTADLTAGPHGTTIRFEADGLPASKPGQHYEVWLSDGRSGITAGTFRVGPDGKARCKLATAGRAEHFRVVDVTVEPDVEPHDQRSTAWCCSATSDGCRIRARHRYDTRLASVSAIGHVEDEAFRRLR